TICSARFAMAVALARSTSAALAPDNAAPGTCPKNPRRMFSRSTRRRVSCNCSSNNGLSMDCDSCSASSRDSTGISGTGGNCGCGGGGLNILFTAAFTAPPIRAGTTTSATALPHLLRQAVDVDVLHNAVSHVPLALHPFLEEAVPACQRTFECLYHYRITSAYTSRYTIKFKELKGKPQQLAYNR